MWHIDDDRLFYFLILHEIIISYVRLRKKKKKLAQPHMMRHSQLGDKRWDFLFFIIKSPKKLFLKKLNNYLKNMHVKQTPLSETIKTFRVIFEIIKEMKAQSATCLSLWNISSPSIN